ncbi:FG-GAP-like repeat-containing protein [Pedobacter psychroterrae]|uniref:T9SS type B sorting domain-containing protein n=1 Tax=Pedobacter psychroterrae TaxID=2530453 RepID=A0A4R0NPY7_9SPHI|nr:FG-GAP-like repeat-containing protein [Pedobacter psychroterrae]TCD01305.1 T9SS type B sorting domain-containing protein [Pedobacter psychroterrae]
MLLTSMQSALMAQVVITGISPLSGAPGTTVTIQGSGFSNVPAGNQVSFGATRGEILTATTSSISVIVPQGASYSAIQVLNTQTHLLAQSSAFFLPRTPPGRAALQTSDFGFTYGLLTASGPVDLKIADLDGDGLADVAVACSTSDMITVSRNTSAAGKLNFVEKQDFRVGDLPQALAAGDIDGDGKIDLVSANGNANTVTLLRNTSSPGSISFVRMEILTGRHSGDVAIADFDGDGRSDLAVVSRDKMIILLRNNGTAGNPAFAPKIEIQAYFNPLAIALGDMDNDGKADIVIADFTNYISILRNTGSAGTISFALRKDFATGDGPRNLTLADMDGDGRLDVATAHNGTVSLLRNTSSPGSVNMAPVQHLPGGLAGYAIASGDIDGDGKVDLASANWTAPVDEGLTLLKNTSSPNSFSLQPKVPFRVIRAPFAVAISDLDSDGKPEVVVVRNSDGSATIYQNKPAARPTLQATNITFSDITSGSAEISWTKGNGNSRVVFIKADPNSGSPVPVDGTTYTAESTYKNGDQILNSGWYAIYNGNGTTTGVSGLDPATRYQVMVCEYEGMEGHELYLTSPAQGNPASFQTSYDETTLTSLILSPMGLNEVFNPMIVDYTAFATSNQSSVTLTATVSVPGATITINGEPAISGSPSNPIPLNMGDNTIEVLVTATDEYSTRAYTIIVNRGKTAQIVNMPDISTMTLCDDDFRPVANADSGLPITYTSSNPAVAVITPAGLIHLTGPGTTQITAKQAGNGQYIPAQQTRTLTVSPPEKMQISIHALENPVKKGTPVQFNAITNGAKGMLSYQWKVNGIPMGMNRPTFELNDPQEGDKVSCELSSDARCTLPGVSNIVQVQIDPQHKTFPSAFTPNGDGINDFWELPSAAGETISLRIFNRSGTILYHSDAYDNKWNGTYQGQPLNAGTYYYLIRISPKGKPLSGSVTLIY